VIELFGFAQFISPFIVMGWHVGNPELLAKEQSVELWLPPLTEWLTSGVGGGVTGGGVMGGGVTGGGVTGGTF
jgi:hypothetical protein